MPSTKKAVVKRAGRHDLVLPNVTRVATRPQVPPRPKNPTNTGKRRTTRPLGGLWNGFHRIFVGAKPREGRGGDTVDLIPVWMAACIGCVEVFDANPDPTVGFVPIGDALVWHWSITEDVPDSYFHCALTCHAEASARAAHLLECPNATQYRYLAVQWELEQEQTKEKKEATKQAMALKLPSRDTSLAIIGEHFLLVFISHHDNEKAMMSAFPHYMLSWAEQNDVLQCLDLYDVMCGEVTYSILVEHVLSCPLASAEARDTAQFLDQNSTNLIELIGDDIPPRLNPMSADEEPQLEWGVETDDRGRRSYCDHKDNWGRGKSDGCRGARDVNRSSMESFIPQSVKYLLDDSGDLCFTDMHNTEQHYDAKPIHVSAALVSAALPFTKDVHNDLDPEIMLLSLVVVSPGEITAEPPMRPLSN
ncbi:hypothetical protein HMN09_00158300 [Mycena chlorophos]|uniref:Uncharacterized protein n=1 Tax=Mycena chlorophos TaxID=658473 RepID=A0A8H6TS39_MYCCL|nr:hypothetical protein HMN09_00158300 [Mycena chlorophos]